MTVEAHIPEITRVIQLAVAPVFLLTAVGTILAALNIRLGRAVDRRRVLEDRLQGGSGGEALLDEIERVRRRIRLVYLSILCAVACGLFVCLLIAGAFLGAFVAVDLTRMVAAMFVLAMIALIASLLLFLRELFYAVTTPRSKHP